MSSESGSSLIICRRFSGAIFQRAAGVPFPGLSALFGAGLMLGTLMAGRPVLAQNVQFLQNVTIVAGNASVTGSTTSYTGDGSSALSATFDTSAQAVTEDPLGNIFIADTKNNAIRRVDAVTGLISTYAGLGPTATLCTTGTNVYGDGCLATTASLNGPYAVKYFRGNGTGVPAGLYIADTADNEVRYVNPQTNYISVFAGVGAYDTTGNPVASGKAANTTTISGPQGIVFDGAGDAFLALGGGKGFILRVDGVTQKVTVLAGTGTPGTTGDGGPGTSAELQTPNGIALDPQGNVYFSSGMPNSVRKITVATGIITTYAGGGSSICAAATNSIGDGCPATQATLGTPQAIAIDSFGNLFIADELNARIREVNAAGIITTVVGTGTKSNSKSGVAAPNANLNSPMGVDLTAAGDLIILDSYNREAKVASPPVNIAATAIGAKTVFTATVRVNAALTLGSFGVPAGYPYFINGAITGCTVGSAVAAGTLCTVSITFQPTAAGVQGAPLNFVDSNGNTYTLAISGVGTAPAALLLPGVINAVAGNGTSAGNTGNGGAAGAALLNGSRAVAVDSANNYYIADTANNQVREIVAATGNIVVFAGTGAAGFSGDGGPAKAAVLNAPAGLAVDGAGNVYISDTGNNRVRVVSAAGVISTLAGTGTAGALGDLSAASAAQLSAPLELALNPTGVLYVADSGNNKIRSIGLRSLIINTLAGVGTAGFSGDTNAAGLAQLSAPAGVAVDNSGNVYIADTGNQVIRVVSVSGTGGSNNINTLAGTGGSAGTSNGANSAALFMAPTSVAVDAAANVYVADSGNNEIRLISGGQVSTVAGTSAAASSGNGGLSTAAALNGPQGVALDTSGNILIADTGNNQLRSVNVAATSFVYANTSPNTNSLAQIATLTNSGNAALAVASVSAVPNFPEQASGALDCNGSGVSLNPGASCEVSLVFAPTALQNYSGTVVLTDNAQAGQTAATQSIAVSGLGQYVFTASISAPATAPAGSPVSVTVSVTNPAQIYGGTLHFMSSDPTATLPADYTYTAADKGKHVFTGIVFRTVNTSNMGMQTLTVTDTVNQMITAKSLITVQAGAPASLVIVSGNNQSAGISTNYGSVLTVKALDASGNLAAGVPVTFTTPTSGPFALFPKSASTFTASTSALGTVSSPQLTADGVTGTFQVTAMAAGVPAVTFNLTNTSTVAAGFNLTSNPGSFASLPPGTSGTVTITITPVGGFNSPVNVACTGAIPTTTCTLSTQTVAQSGNGNSTSFNLTLATTGLAQSSRLETVRGPVYACLVLLSGFAAVRRRTRFKGLLLALLCCMMLAGLEGCGSGVNTAASAGGSTPVGTYALTVTGTSGSITSSVVINYYVAGAPLP